MATDYSRLLKPKEKAKYELRALFEDAGYEEFRTGKFEDYELYSANRDFLGSEGMITFTDASGHLMALKPDVTLSVAKDAAIDSGAVKKVYYDDEVYRMGSYSHDFREIDQTGIECMGDIDSSCIAEVILFAARSLDLMDKEYVLDISHMKIVGALIKDLEIPDADSTELMQHISQKNQDAAGELLDELGVDTKKREVVTALAVTSGSIKSSGEIRDTMDFSAFSEETRDSVMEGFDELRSLGELLEREGLSGSVNIDFSLVNEMSYYNGIMFQGFVRGLSKPVLSGGRYDNLMRKMGKKCGAIGFSVSLSLLDQFNTVDPGVIDTVKGSMINIALPKGRLGDRVYELFDKAGYGCPGVREESRKLVFEDREKGIRFFMVKPSDVSVYVARGAADIGVAGLDILLEYRPDVYELLDLREGICRMMVAAPEGYTGTGDKSVRVATKFPNIAGKFFEGKGREIDTIELHGSIELAPILGLSDVIVDIVETGGTLKANGLVEIEKVADISARLIANKASVKFKEEAVGKLVRALEGVIN